jgi:hypothetical protein
MKFLSFYSLGHPDVLWPCTRFSFGHKDRSSARLCRLAFP